MNQIHTLLEKSKHELGDMTISEDHFVDAGNRFYTIELLLSKKARKANPALPLYLSVTDSSVHSAKNSLAYQLTRYK